MNPSPHPFLYGDDSRAVPDDLESDMANKRTYTKRKQSMPNDRLSTLVRMSVLAWSASLLTASYLGIVRDLDATFIAGLLTSTLGTFGLSVVGKPQSQQDPIKAPRTAPKIPTKPPTPPVT